MNLTRTVDRGNFYCPTCGSNQAYRLRHRRPFLTIYFIPVVPVGAAEPFVQCEGCRSHWDPSVLEMTRESHEEAQREQFREEALRAAILVTIADGSITDEEIDALLRVSNNLLQRPLEREELGMQCASAQRLGVPAENYILSVKNRWSEEQCRAALQAAFLAASAGGDLNDQQVKMLARLQEMFHLTDDEYQEIIEDSLMIS